MRPLVWKVKVVRMGFSGKGVISVAMAATLAFSGTLVPIFSAATSPVIAYADTLEAKSGTFNGMDWAAIPIEDGSCYELVLGDGGSQTLTMGSDTNEESWPWYDWKTSIKSVRVSGAVTATGSLRAMFNECSGIERADLSGLDTSGVTSLERMFRFCVSLTSVDMSGFDTGNVTSMMAMFYQDAALESVDLSSFSFNPQVDLLWMFRGCGNLKTIYVVDGTDLSYLNGTGNAELGITFVENGMFEWCSSLVGGNGTTFSDEHIGGSYARVDGLGDLPGYFTASSMDGPWAGGPTGSGETELNVMFESIGEYGGTEELLVIPAPSGTDPADLVDAAGDPNPNGEYILNPHYNPDNDGDGYGDNLQFTVPASINYVVRADGDLVGPTNVYVDNLSAFQVHVNSLDVDAEPSFAIVSNVDDVAGMANVVDLKIGPAAGQLDVSKFLERKPIVDISKWNMAAENADAATDELTMVTAGHVRNIAEDITKTTKFGEIHWRLRAGGGILEPIDGLTASDLGVANTKAAVGAWLEDNFSGTDSNDRSGYIYAAYEDDYYPIFECDDTDLAGDSGVIVEATAYLPDDSDVHIAVANDNGTYKLSTSDQLFWRHSGEVDF